MGDGLGPLQEPRPHRGCRDESLPSLPEAAVPALIPGTFGAGDAQRRGLSLRERGAAWAARNCQEPVEPRNPRDMK